MAKSVFQSRLAKRRDPNLDRKSKLVKEQFLSAYNLEEHNEEHLKRKYYFLILIAYIYLFQTKQRFGQFTGHG